MSPYASYLIETLVTLVGVCAFAGIVLYGARRIGIARDSGALELVGRLAVDARRSIVLVKIGEMVFVVGVGDGGMTKLGEIAASSLPARAATEPRSFAAVLAKALQRGATGSVSTELSEASPGPIEAPKS